MNRIIYFLLLFTLTNAYIINGQTIAECSTPTNVSVYVTPNGALEMNWDEQTDIMHYLISGGVSGSMKQASITTLSNNFYAPNLRNCSNYQVKVTSVCKNGNDQFESDLISFATSGCVECDIPQNLTTQFINSSSAVLNWDPIPNATGYVIEGKEARMDRFIHIYTPNNYFEASELYPRMDYEWRVYSVCGHQKGTPSVLTNFTTASTKKNSSVDFTNELNLFPNPVDQTANIEVSLSKASSVKISIVDISGRLLINITENLYEGDNELSIDVSDLQKGIYIIIAELEDEVLTKRFTIYR